MKQPSRGETDANSLQQVEHLAAQSLLLLSSGVVSYIGAFALNVLLARILGASGFGAWVVAFSVARTLATIGLMGADWILLRQGSYYEGIDDRLRLRRTVHLALAFATSALLALGLVLLMLSSTLANTVFHRASIAPLLRLTAILIPVMGVGQLMIFGTQAFKSMREAALIRNILQPVARLGCVAAALLIVKNEVAAFAGLLGAEIILTAASTYALNRRLPLIGPTAPIERAKLIGFAVPVWGTKIVDVARTQLFPVLLGSLTSLFASGVFVASSRVAVAPSAIIATLNQVYRPMGGDLYLQNRRDELASLFKSIGKWSFALGFPIFCLQVAFAEDILSLFGQAFRSQTSALILLAIGMFFNFSTGPVSTTLIMSGRASLAFLDHVVVLGAEIALALWLIPAYGLLGAVATRMLGTALTNGLRLAQVWWYERLHPYRLDYWKPVLAGLIAVVGAKVAVAISGYAPGVLTAAVATGVLGLIYIGILAALGLSAEDRAALEPVLRKVRRRMAPS